MREDKYSVLLHFRGKDKFLYEKIRRDADTEQLPVSTYMRLLMRSNLEKEIIIKSNNEETENRKTE